MFHTRVPELHVFKSSQSFIVERTRKILVSKILPIRAGEERGGTCFGFGVVWDESLRFGT